MTQRSDRIPLPAHEARCEPSTPGQAASRCARARALVGTSPLADFTVYPGFDCTVVCPQYVDLNSLRMDAAKPQRPVLPPIGSTTR